LFIESRRVRPYYTQYGSIIPMNDDAYSYLHGTSVGGNLQLSNVMLPDVVPEPNAALLAIGAIPVLIDLQKRVLIGAASTNQ
jgi:hypothetical protein